MGFTNRFTKKRGGLPGMDKINLQKKPPNLSIAESITQLLKTKFETCIVPEQLKEFQQSDQFSKEEKNQFEIYRPIMIKQLHLFKMNLSKTFYSETPLNKTLLNQNLS